MAGSALLRLWRSKHYSLGELIGALRGMGATQRRLLPALQGFNLLARNLRVRPPVAIFQGRHDAATVPALAPKLAGHLGAALVWFEDSAHSPQEEEPERFRAELLRFIEGAVEPARALGA
jgi:pimeloyl-ACP methyl ester carboxylesterase